MGCNLGLIFLGCCIIIAAFMFVAPATTITLVTTFINALVSVIFWVIIAAIVAMVVLGVIVVVALHEGLS